MTENVKDNEVLDCQNHRDKICNLRTLKKMKYYSSLVKSFSSELWTSEQTMDFRAVRIFQKDPYKPVLPESEHLRGKQGCAK